MSRVRGGFRGLLAALESGDADELNPDAPFDAPDRLKLTRAERRAFMRRARRRARAQAKRKALAERPPY